MKGIGRLDRFANEMISHGDPTRAAVAAGYSKLSATRLAVDPQIVAAIASAIERNRVRFGLRGLLVLDRIAHDENQPAGARATCARTLVEHAGLLNRKGFEAASKDPSEMTTDELRDLVSRLDRELGDRAKPVNSAQSEPLPADVLDMTA